MNVWEPREQNPEVVGHVRVVRARGFRWITEQEKLKEKVLECVPEGSTFYPFHPDTSMLPQPGTHQYYAAWQVGVCHPSFADVNDTELKLIPYHTKQILADGTIADEEANAG